MYSFIFKSGKRSGHDTHSNEARPHNCPSSYSNGGKVNRSIGLLKGTGVVVD
jgi:hypothetical protein